MKETATNFEPVVERIAAGDSITRVCVCGNTPSDYGFYPCSLFGKITREIADGNRLHLCGNCGRIINLMTLEIIGQAPKQN